MLTVNRSLPFGMERLMAATMLTKLIQAVNNPGVMMLSSAYNIY